MKEQQFMDAMDGWFANASPSEIESSLDSMKNEWIENYRKVALGKYQKCLHCGRYSKKDQIQYQKKEKTKILSDEEKVIFVKEVRLEYFCPLCARQIWETTVQLKNEANDEVAYCTCCKKPVKLADCKQNKSTIQDSEMYYYNTLRYHCPTCGMWVKDIDY